MKQNLLHSLIGAHMTREGVGGAATHVALTADQLNGKDGLRRVFEVRDVNTEDRTVELSFSSEIEGQRWFGIEILGHGPGEIVMDRLLSGASLLVNHDWDDQVGVVESASIRADRKGVAKVRFGRSQRADEIFKDVQDGIRRLVSVGYRVLEAKLIETREDGTDVYRITKWEPYEISLVSVPFDTSVGIGRSLENPQEEPVPAKTENNTVRNGSESENTFLKGNNTMEKILRDASGNLVRALVDEAGNITQVLEMLEKAGDAAASHVQRGADTERNRVRGITDLGTQYGQRDMALQFIADGKTPEEFQRALLDKMNQRDGKPSKPASDAPSATIGMTDREVRQFSLFRAVRALLPNASAADREAAAFEFECSAAAERQYGKQAQGILIPQDVLDRAFNAGGAPNTPTGAITGSNLVATEHLAGSFVEMLRARNTIMRLAQVMGGLVGNVEVPKQTGGATAYWIGEGEDATEGTPVIGQLALTPHTVAAYTDITRRLMLQSTPDAEGIVRRDLVAAIAQAIDKAGYYGSGAGNEPRGIKNYTGINAVDFAATQPTYAELVQMETEIAADNADVNSMAYVLNAVARGAAKTTPKFPSGASVAAAGTVWEPGNTINGYRAEVTNQLATGDVFFGNFADLIVGLWGGLDVTVDPYSLSKSGGTRIVVFQDVDFAVRRLESFAYGSATVTP